MTDTQFVFIALTRPHSAKADPYAIVSGLSPGRWQSRQRLSDDDYAPFQKSGDMTGIWKATWDETSEHYNLIGPASSTEIASLHEDIPF